MTPAAIDATMVAVATIRRASTFSDVRVEDQYRHIEIFNSTTGSSIKITQNIRPLADHFNPFVIDGAKRIGYHCAKRKLLMGGSADSVWSPVWNKNSEKDTLYVCMGPSFQATKQVDICAFTNVSQYLDTDTLPPPPVRLISDGFNNAFPSTNPDGTKLVFRSNARGVNGGEEKYMNLYIMEDAQSPTSEIKRLTEGKWTDTQCRWSPSGDWIVFSSSRDKPDGAPATDNGLDEGYFAVFLVKWDEPSVVVRVMASGSDIAGHVNHPIFSPDGASIVVAADLAAVSVDPISLPLFLHSLRPYGDIFTVDIDPTDITENKDRDMKYITRSTHSKFENSTDTWAIFPSQVMDLEWIMNLTRGHSSFSPACPYIQSNGGESWHMTGQLLIPGRKC